MGILHDLVEGGFMDIVECKEEFEDWYEEGGFGYRMRHYGDASDIYEMALSMYEKGFDEFGDSLIEDLLDAVDYYEEKFEYSIQYDAGLKRWRSTETGQFISDPYSWIRD